MKNNTPKILRRNRRLLYMTIIVFTLAISIPAIILFRKTTIMSAKNVDELMSLGGPVVVFEDGRQVGELPAERVRLDTVTDVVMKPNFRLDFNTVQAPDGTLYTAASPGYLFISQDEGRTWRRRSMTHLLKGEWKSGDNDLWVGMRIRGLGIVGETLLLYVHDSLDGQPPRVLIFRSTDGGETWEDSGEVDYSPYPSAGGDASGFYTLSDGTVLLSIQGSYYTAQPSDADLPPEKQSLWSLIYRSTDNGMTWGERSVVGDHTCETQLLVKRDGNILAVIRRQGSSTLAKEAHKTLFLADSFDQGRTWVNLRQVVKKLGSCHGEALQLSDGRVVLIYHKRYPYEDNEILALVSSDGGKTWGPRTYAICKGSGYPGSVVLDDDTIVTVTGDEKLDPEANVLPPGHTAQVIRWRIP